MAQEKDQLKVGVILSYINLGIGNLIPIFYTPIMLALLGQSEYGLYKLSSSVTSYLSLVSLGIGSAVSRYLIKERTQSGKDAEEKILGLFMVIFQIIAVAAFIIGMLLTFNLGIWYGNSLTSEELGRMKILVFLMVCNTALSFSVSPYVSVVTAHEKFVFLQCMNIISTSVMPIANLVALWMGFASVGMAVSSLVLNIIIRFFYLIYVRRNLNIKAKYIGMPVAALKEILIFSFWIFVGNVVGQLYNSTDTVMIGAVPELATKGVAVYNIGLTFNSIMFSLTTAISNLLSPKVNKLVFAGTSNNDLTKLAARVGRLQCYIMFLVVTGFIAFGRPFVYFYAGPAYSEAYWVAVLMMVPNMIPLVQSVFLSIITAQNRHQFRSIVYLGIAIINVLGTWILMHIMGIIGAALMTGMALLIGQGFIMNWYYSKKIGLNILYFWKEIGQVIIWPTILCVITLIVSRFVNFYDLRVLMIGIVVYTILFAVVSLRFVVNDYERDLIYSPLNTIISKLAHWRPFGK